MKEKSRPWAIITKIFACNNINYLDGFRLPDAQCYVRTDNPIISMRYKDEWLFTVISETLKIVFWVRCGVGYLFYLMLGLSKENNPDFIFFFIAGRNIR